MTSLPDGAVMLRLSGGETTLCYTHAEWTAFLRGLHAGEFPLQTAA
jgi:hypothetical protein